MTKRLLSLRRNPTLVLLLAVSTLLSTFHVSSAQEPRESSAPRVELLTMNGGKPNLSPTGEGITSYKIQDLFQRGTTSIIQIKPADAPFKIELPTGYSLFNNLVYAVKTDVVFSGITDITFSFPTARTKQTFEQIRILYPEYDHADPDVPKWIDATLDDHKSPRAADYLSDLEINQRLRDFKTRTLHALAEGGPRLLVVATRDTSKLRERFAADLVVSGTATPQVTEGRSVTYELKLTNKGPDTATQVSLHAGASAFSFVSVTASQGKCRMEAQNVYCKFSNLEKDRTVDIKIVERCPWGHLSENAPPSHAFVMKFVQVGGVEQDALPESNQLQLETQVHPDSNQGPVIQILSPGLSQLFPGPAATVPIRFKASDPDGFIKKLELFGSDLSTPAKSLGEPTLVADGEYELIYKDVPFGRQWVTIVATDNLGRVASVRPPEFFVNGTARIEITDPKPGSKLNLADGEFTVTIHASNSSSRLKKVSLDGWDSDATPVGNDNYVVKSKYCSRQCRLQAIAIDEKGVETRSEYLEFTMAQPPDARLTWFDGEYRHLFEGDKPFKVSELILIASADHRQVGNNAAITKIEILANGAVICTDDVSSTGFGFSENCVWKPAPGKYRLQVVATDEDGAVGKSNPIDVVIERP